MKYRSWSKNVEAELDDRTYWSTLTTKKLDKNQIYETNTFDKNDDKTQEARINEYRILPKQSFLLKSPYANGHDIYYYYRGSFSSGGNKKP